MEHKNIEIIEGTDLANHSFTAVSFDLSEHGERTIGIETHEAMVERVSSNHRLYFWPIIASTAEEFPRLIDWSIKNFEINELPNQEHGFSPEMWHNCLEWFCTRAATYCLDKKNRGKA